MALLLMPLSCLLHRVYNKMVLSMYDMQQGNKNCMPYVDNWHLWRCLIRCFVVCMLLWRILPERDNNWAAIWDFQQCGTCGQQRLRSACAYAQSDQSLCWCLEYSMTVKLLTVHHFECLSLKGGCTGWSESRLIKMRHFWKWHVLAHVCITCNSGASLRGNLTLLCENNKVQTSLCIAQSDQHLCNSLSGRYN